MISLRTLLRSFAFFARTKNTTLFFSSDPALIGKKHGGACCGPDLKLQLRLSAEALDYKKLSGPMSTIIAVRGISLASQRASPPINSPIILLWRTRSFPLTETFGQGYVVACPSANTRNFACSRGVERNNLRPPRKFICSLKGMAVLEAIALAKFYGSVPAVREVSFRLEPGQVLGYLGPNGSGKSTTVKVLTGLLQPTHGQVLFEGKDIQSDLVSYRKRLGYVPEEANLYPFLTGEEYLEMIGTLRAMSPTRMKTKIAALLEFFSLFPHRHVSLGSYSKGMRQRILLIAALMDNPDVLILDEPLSGLDVTSVLIFKNLIQAFSARGKAVFYCSHILEVVEKVCSQLLILRKGQVIAYGSTEEVRQRIGQSSLERIFLQLVEDTDVTQVANEIVDVVVSPS